VVEKWLASHPEVTLLRVSAVGGNVIVDLAGSDASQITSDLWKNLQAKLGATVKLSVRFAKLTQLTP
jgi:hypothetical protein